MGRRKRNSAEIGRALIKDRFRGKTVHRGAESFLHTTELNDGYEGRSVNLQSLTEQTSLDDFLLTAEMAGRDFTAEKENVQLVTAQLNSGVMSGEKLDKVKKAQDLWKDLLRIPRRPAWQESTPADKLRQDEHMSFLDWRRKLARVQEEEHITVTPYEKNLEFWRQLWRVIERSDVVVQIVDARNPLLFWCPDLDLYVREVDPDKQTLLLINKADLLTASQRQAWARYFAAQGVRIVFWSATEEAARLEGETNISAEETAEACDEAIEGVNMPESDTEDKETSDASQNSSNEKDVEACGDEEDDDDSDGCSDNKGKETNAASQNSSNEKDVEDCGDEEDEVDSDGYETYEEYTDEENEAGSEVACGSESVKTRPNNEQTNTQRAGEEVDSKTESGNQRSQSRPQASQAVDVADSCLQTSDDFLDLLRGMARTHCLEGVTTVGMVGYPNVGKSSTINTILQTKKVAVSATPGRTKHFQTLYVEKDLMLCDCPGLVFPSFVNSKAELVVNGILPIDQLQDSEPPVELVCHHVGRGALEALYHLNLPPPEEWEDQDKAPSAYDLLQAYGALRGFMSHKGNPDRPRGARYILKDFVNGKLLFCHPPPGIEAAVFQKPPYGAPRELKGAPRPAPQKTASQMKTEALDKEFFAKTCIKAHIQGPHTVDNYVRMERLRPVCAGQGPSSSADSSSPHSSQASINGKPWKRHNNRNKKEKLRKVYRDLDTH
ncbi:hypothetical protein ACOMHN_062882 [Nucella lapillus]